MLETPSILARALIAIHGAGAVDTAERAAKESRTLRLVERAAEWEQIIATIKTLQQISPANDHVAI